MRWTSVIGMAVLMALPATSQQKQDKNNRPPTIVVMARPYGLDPPRIKVKPGKLVVIVLNRSGAKELQLHLDSDRGDRLREIAMPYRNKISNEQYELTPGIYVLRETRHPMWSCRIIVGWN